MGLMYLQLPRTYPTFFVGVMDEWWDDEDYSHTMTKDHTDFLLGSIHEEIALVFASRKLGKGKKYALMALVFSSIDEDAYIRGLIHLGDYDEAPNEDTKNKAYLDLVLNDKLDSFQHGERYYIGEGDEMRQIKQIIEAWMDGLINVSGSIPDYDFVRTF
jgi:hypothetical protein